MYEEIKCFPKFEVIAILALFQKPEKEKEKKGLFPKFPTFPGIPRTLLSSLLLCALKLRKRSWLSPFSQFCSASLLAASSGVKRPPTHPPSLLSPSLPTDSLLSPPLS